MTSVEQFDDDSRERNSEDPKTFFESQMALKEQKLQTLQFEIITEKKRSENLKWNFTISLIVLIVILLAMAAICFQLFLDQKMERLKNFEMEIQLLKLTGEKQFWQEKYESLLDDVLMQGRQFVDNETKYMFCMSACQAFKWIAKVAIGHFPGASYLIE